ncbi:MAG: bifunctional heptose 7-phosphate kinase/heptose 1-phosphate adenyltransferase [Planctomycetota bacterium]
MNDNFTISETLLNIIDNYKKIKIGVIGDFVLDHFIFGKSEKLSREAPIPIVDVENEIFTAGCAGNAALNISSLGSQAFLFGFIGNDFYSKKLLEAFSKRNNINIDTLTIIPEMSIPVKMRVLTSQANTRKQQVCRVDKYKKNKIKETFWEMTLMKVKEYKDNMDGFIISDYNYELFENEQFVDNLKKVLSNKIVLVDSHSRLELLKGFTIFTPNEEEARELVEWAEISSDSYNALLEIILGKTEGKIAIVTLGKKGIICKEKNNSLLYLPPFLPNIEAVDTTGAGDTVAVTFLLSYITSKNVALSTLLAQIAAHIVIQQIGTIPCESSDLIKTISQYQEYIPLFYQQKN